MLRPVSGDRGNYSVPKDLLETIYHVHVTVSVAQYYTRLEITNKTRSKTRRISIKRVKSRHRRARDFRKLKRDPVVPKTVTWKRFCGKTQWIFWRGKTAPRPQTSWDDLFCFFFPRLGFWTTSFREPPPD